MRLHGSILGTLAWLCVVAGRRPGSSTDFARARAGLSGVCSGRGRLGWPRLGALFNINKTGAGTRLFAG